MQKDRQRGDGSPGAERRGGSADAHGGVHSRRHPPELAKFGPGLQPGEAVDVTVEKGVYHGLGLARHGGHVVFIPRAFPGDRLRVRVESVARGYARGVTEAVLEPAPHRRTSPCPYVPRCGGCSYQELDYEAQLRLKESILRESLARSGVAWEDEIPLRASPEVGWRTRASFHLEATQGQLLLGLHEEGSRRVVDLERCLQVSAGMNAAARALRRALADNPRWAGSVSDLDLAESLDESRLVAALHTGLPPAKLVALRSLMDAAPGLSGLGAVVGRGRSRRYVSLAGDPHVEAVIHGFQLTSHVRSFFQANRFLVHDLVQTVLAFTPPGGTVLDLYAGVGLFAIPLAARAERVLGAEINPQAAEDAVTNAKRAGFNHVRIRRGDVRRALASWPTAPEERVVLDPPRAGAGAEVVAAVAARRPDSVVYVSCDPPTLGRDLRTFAAEGYRADRIMAFDLFPDTAHLEAVVRLTPA